MDWELVESLLCIIIFPLLQTSSEKYVCCLTYVIYLFLNVLNEWSPHPPWFQVLMDKCSFNWNWEQSNGYLFF